MNARDPVGPFPSNPGDWYEAKEREARELSEQLRQAKERGASEEEIKRIERQLEQARYVGD